MAFLTSVIVFVECGFVLMFIKLFFSPYRVLVGACNIERLFCFYWSVPHMNLYSVHRTRSTQVIRSRELTQEGSVIKPSAHHPNDFYGQVHAVHSKVQQKVPHFNIRTKHYFQIKFSKWGQGTLLKSRSLVKFQFSLQE